LYDPGAVTQRWVRLVAVRIVPQLPHAVFVVCRGDLQCMAAADMPIVGTCYISADMLAEDDQAMATAIW
jgi:hypothetical protein